jgi:hypothetical protein
MQAGQTVEPWPLCASARLPQAAPTARLTAPAQVSGGVGAEKRLRPGPRSAVSGVGTLAPLTLATPTPS